MVSESFKTSYFTCGKAVLILVLVEDGLGGTLADIFSSFTSVLILVLVEDGLGVN